MKKKPSKNTKSNHKEKVNKNAKSSKKKKVVITNSGELYYDGISAS